MKILVVDDEELVQVSVEADLADPQLAAKTGVHNEVTCVGNVSEAKALLEREVFDLAFLDIRLGPYHKSGGIELLRHIKKECLATVVIMMTSVEDTEVVEQCLLEGASDYVIKPFDSDKAHWLMLKARGMHKLVRKQQAQRSQAGPKSVKSIPLTTKSPLFQRVIDQATKLKGSGLSALILGENGVGKELLANYIWGIEGDGNRPFVSLDSSAIPENLIESILFGHRKGSFTGADEHRVGLIQAAHGGDFFLDELANMSMDVQQKLLRAVQSKAIKPVGSTEDISVNFRLICATNGDLEAMVKAGTFRQDLYFRIKRAVLTIPPLRQRTEDIPDLIELFLNKYSLGAKQLGKEAHEYCLQYSWPGNIRELEAAIETLSTLAASNEITLEELKSQLIAPTVAADYAPGEDSAGNYAAPFGLTEESIRHRHKRLLLDFEQAMVRLATNKAGSENKAAEWLGLSRSTLTSKRISWGWKDSDGNSGT